MILDINDDVFLELSVTYSHVEHLDVFLRGADGLLEVTTENGVDDLVPIHYQGKKWIAFTNVGGVPFLYTITWGTFKVLRPDENMKVSFEKFAKKPPMIVRGSDVMWLAE